jgi:hypothetical protein
MAVYDHFRANARRPVSLQAAVATEGAGSSITAQVVDLGLGGACLEVTQPYRVGQPVTLEFFAPDLWDPLILGARVAWNPPLANGAASRVGFRFEHRTGAALSSLVELIGSFAYA